MKIVLATNNSHKIKEYRSLFANMPIEVLSLSDVAIKSDIEETGTSYEENAAIKAENIAQLTKFLVI
ncbi:MAG TPA: non-canonical purine NTP pyrophosphatase, partial [Bacilli bacterium]|nr:non-canonical purine NTP pyrophosphatase [Bacilli bacterium]